MAKIGYIRVSTKEQNAARQEIALRDLVMDRLYVEKLSGAHRNRPELDKMLEYVREGDTVYVESLSRLARSTKDLLNLMDTFTRKRVNLVSLKENFDTNSPQGKLIFTIFSALSEFERETIRERQREGIDARKQKGLKLGRDKIQPPKNWEEVVRKWENHEITAIQAMRLTGLNRGTFYRRYREYMHE